MAAVTPTRAGRIALGCCLILSPLWLLVMFDRALWTPDEPREADIAWRMSMQADRTIPTLAGEPFLEKPPLLYWASGAAAAAFPAHEAALRLPNFVFAWLTTSAIVLLAAALAGRQAAWISGLTAGTFLIALQVSAWLATDAALMVGVAGSLLGAYRGMQSRTLRAQLAWYTLMHASLTWAFLAKGPAGWLVPGCALLVLMGLARNGQPLRSLGFWLPAVIPVAAIGAWTMSAARTPEGAHNLSVLLWSNVAGRFVPLSTADAAPYSAAHANYFGKYLIELPFYVAPWIFLLIAALRRAWFRVRDEDGDAWRFAIAILVAPILLLSFASTARGIYIAPLLPACGVLIGLWFAESTAAPGRFDRWMLSATFALVAVFVLAILVAAGLVASAEVGLPAPVLFLVIAALIGLASLLIARHQLRAQRLQPFMTALLVAFIGTLTISSIILFPAIDRWQDISSIVRAADHDAATRVLILYRPDETTRALLDRLSLAQRPSLTADTPETLRALLRQQPAAAVLALVRGRADGPLNRRLRSLGIRVRGNDGSKQATELSERLGLPIERVYEVPLGRRYVLFGAARPSSASPGMLLTEKGAAASDTR